MYVSPSVELTHLTKPLLCATVLQMMLQKLTGATGPLAAPETSESEARLWTACKEVVQVAGVRGGVCGCGRGQLVGGRSWVVRLVLAGRTGSFLSFPTSMNMRPMKSKVAANFAFFIIYWLSHIYFKLKKTQQLAAFFINQSVLLSFLDCSVYSVSWVINHAHELCRLMLLHSLADVIGTMENDMMFLH